MDGSELVLAKVQPGASGERVAAEHLSFDQAFIMHHRVVYRYAYGLTRDQGLSEDITQEVFIRLYHHLDWAQRDGLLRAWLLRVTANVTRNAVRGRNRARIRDEAFVARTERTDSIHPDESLIQQDRIAETRRTLAKISEPMRSCILLKHEGLSYREIAATLGINEKNVGSLVSRARREFIRIYGKIGKR
ncbi:MAG TPA: sigma-70 family RNA polymerase sigma factor [Blastocatellia bacterium]|nr:sigma-70 family RNA polymerase sigma factor [Blastocatellia bacterium]